MWKAIENIMILSVTIFEIYCCIGLMFGFYLYKGDNMKNHKGCRSWNRWRVLWRID